MVIWLYSNMVIYEYSNTATVTAIVMVIITRIEVMAV